jgi:hypothetical protein
LRLFSAIIFIKLYKERRLKINMVKYTEALNKGLKFSIQPKRWLPVFILDLIIFSVFIAVTVTNTNMLTSLASMGTITLTVFESLGYIGLFFGLLIIWGLVIIWIHGAIVYQSYKEKQYDKSWKLAKNKYLSILGAVVVVGIISIIVGLVPFVGWILSIIVGLMFFFILQGIMIKNQGFIKTMESSWDIFRKRPIDVFAMWLVLTVVSMVILFIFLLPLLLVFGGFVLTIMSTGSVFTALPYLFSNFWAFIIGTVILLIGLSIATVFSIKAQTEFYLQLKKRFFRR